MEVHFICGFRRVAYHEHRELRCFEDTISHAPDGPPAADYCVHELTALNVETFVIGL